MRNVNKLERLLRRLGLTTAKAARILRTSPQTVASWRQGHRNPPRSAIRLLIARAWKPPTTRRRGTVPTIQPLPRYGCHYELPEGCEPDACVIDTQEYDLCDLAKPGMRKEVCRHWLPIKHA